MKIKFRAANLSLIAIVLIVGIISPALFTLLDLNKNIDASIPWYDEDWSFRQAVVIDNESNSEALEDYQVKITLNASNFNFSEALSDGSDIRIVDSDGTTVIPYHIESFDTGAETGIIWVKVPEIDNNVSKNIYIYYGNPTPETFEVPPIGPYEKLTVGSPLFTSTQEGVLPENIVFDSVTNKYWMIVTDRTPVGGSNDQISLYSADTIEGSWTAYGSNPIISGSTNIDSPHLLKYEDTWYLYFTKVNGDVYLATSSSVTGPYVDYPTNPMVARGPGGTWEDVRATENYVFQREDGVWMMWYMGDAGGFVETVGFATADAPTGPWTKSEANPVIDFNTPGTYDAGTIADPFVYKLGDTYYIFYAASDTINPPWTQAYVTTKDFITYKRHNIVLGQGSQEAFDDKNAHRGAIMKFGDYYYMTYAGVGRLSPYLLFQPGLAKQYAKSTAKGYPAQQVLDFYEDFSGSTLPSQLRTEKTAGVSTSTQNISSGVLSLKSGTHNTTRPYNRMYSVQEFIPGHILEARVKHTNADATGNFSSGIGFGRENMYTVQSSSWDSSGKFGSAFNNYDKHMQIDIPSSSSLNIPNNITAEAWIKVNNYSNQVVNYFLNKYSNWAMYIGSNGSLNVIYGAGTVISASGAFTSGDLGNWVHVAFSYDGSTTKIFKNGTQLSTTGTFTGTIGSNVAMTLGSRNTAWYFNGSIDEVRISNVVRYTGSFTAPTEEFTADGNTVLLMHLDEGSGIVVDDVSSSNNNGTISPTAYGFGIYSHNNSNWLKSVVNPIGSISTMSQTLSTSYITQRVYFKSATEVGFQIDDNPIEDISTGIPVGSFPIWFMSVAKNDNTSNGTLDIDWIIVRKYTADEPTLTYGSEVSLAQYQSAPTGSIIIENNDEFTSDVNVQIALTVDDSLDSDENIEMQISEDNTFSGASWIDFAASVNFNLSSTNGSKTVYLRFRDTDNNISSTYSDSISLDDTPPSGSIVINGGNSLTADSNVVLTLTAADNLNTVSSMKISLNSDLSSSDWETFTTTKSFSLGSTQGVKTVYVKFRDSLSNESIVYSDSITFAIPQSVGGGSVSEDTQEDQIIEEEPEEETPIFTDTPIGENEVTYKIRFIDINGNPLIGAKITIIELNKDFITDQEGYINLENIELKEYKITIQYQGKTYSGVLGISDNNQVQTIRVEFDESADSPDQSNSALIILIGSISAVTIGLLAFRKFRFKK